MKKILVISLMMFVLFGSLFAGGAQEAAGEQEMVLNIAHPVLQQNWSPLQGGGHAARWQSLMWAAPMYFDADGVLTPYVVSQCGTQCRLHGMGH